ncbi:MAG: rhodanese-like domain-containing protein [Flavobacteriaceae bacterium CG_4_8_14_3_um_filter_34_10]|nr:rhodanese-like domain-containing protein [Flavobacteriia bacterium]OIP52037.1 MAG: rhodanese [Flavobacteriaceae bacterium CG2_30_34_30]PIQ17476.1 MAG: rhodanese [Flavobacteriaceae bacterium CG18_big_fil_WC_8_21_14_2_50_34_36]PIV51718.1 MAG: rhodanese-like domain-containing protein [Flavobacteriaceae bacterium CG02_land_8_20_14_3_00_34_13]PIX09338.1 MAG: rhodanese-like domain-containing protein [Flavobacteriaceae bacterium CG_4_8_14_3_um_filter_34_10]PIZ07303.1 MAG: rhodanese-like domain-con
MKIIYTLLFSLFLLTISTAQEKEQVELLDAPTYKTAITSKNVQLVDVRTPQEYAKGHIEGSINIDFFETEVFNKKFETLDKEKPVYIYCHSGGRSNKAAKLLLKMGFTKIFDLKGGYASWK